MNLLSKSDNGEFYLLTIIITSDNRYCVSGCYLWSDGSLRVRGASFSYDTKEAALAKCRRLRHIKETKKGYTPTDLSELPERGKEYLKPNVSDYITHAEMQHIIDEAYRERYVEFAVVVGFGDRFDKGSEYLAYVIPGDDEFYYVCDNFGKYEKCHKSRFSRLEPTEKAVEMGVLSG